MKMESQISIAYKGCSKSFAPDTLTDMVAEKQLFYFQHNHCQLQFTFHIAGANVQYLSNGSFWPVHSPSVL